jgi:hypothetical protein
MLTPTKARTAAPWLSLVLMLGLGTAALANQGATPPTGGVWTIAATSGDRNHVDFGLSIRTDHDNWESSDTQSIDIFRGLTSAQLNGNGEAVRFTVARDPGSFECTGWVARGSGGGPFTYAPNPQFATALQGRGMDAPTPMEQFEMTMGDVSLGYIDELRRAGYEPKTSQIVEMIQHGVSRRYVDSLTALGYRPGSIDELMRMRDHGVSVEFLQALRDAGVRPTAEQAIEMRDHGVSAEYLKGIREFGYRPSIDELVQLRDHGVSLEFIARVRNAGYHPSINDLIRLRDAGI